MRQRVNWRCWCHCEREVTASQGQQRLLCPPREHTTGQELGVILLHPALRAAAGWGKGKVQGSGSGQDGGLDTCQAASFLDGGDRLR